MYYRLPFPVTGPRIVVAEEGCKLVAGQENNSDKNAVEVTSFVGIGTLLVLYPDGYVVVVVAAVLVGVGVDVVVVADIFVLGFGVPCQVMKDRFGLAKGFLFVVVRDIVAVMGMYAEVSRRHLDHRYWFDRTLLE